MRINDLLFVVLLDYCVQYCVVSILYNYINVLPLAFPLACLKKLGKKEEK